MTRPSASTTPASNTADRCQLPGVQRAARGVADVEVAEDEPAHRADRVRRRAHARVDAHVRAAFTRLLAGEDQRVVAADLRAQATRAYDLLEAGLAGYGASGDG